MSYEAYKFIHVLGVCLLLGNVTVSAVWKVFADRTGDAVVARFAQRMITVTDIGATVLGIILIVTGGYGAAMEGRIDLFSTSWLVWGQGLFAVSGGLWLGILVPMQIRLARQARKFPADGGVPDTYRRLGRCWLYWGIGATIPLVAAAWVMVAKP